MMSKENITLLKDSGYQYVIGGRLKNKPKKIKSEVLDQEGYEAIAVPEDNEEVFKIKRLEIGEDILFCSWSKKRAAKDQKDRQRLIERAQSLLDEGKEKNILKRGALKYIQMKTQSGSILDETKIAQDSLWDGYYGIQTNNTELTGASAFSYYHDLWRIEESFRLWKTHLETMPVFHYTPKRIKGHFVLCFMAFLMERTLEIELRKNNIEYSPQRIRKALDELEYSEMVVENKTFCLRSPVEGLANNILRVMKIKIPPQITIICQTQDCMAEKTSGLAKRGHK